MTGDEPFVRRPMGMYMAMVVRQRWAITDAAIADTGLAQPSWTVLMQLYQLGDNVSVSELAQMQGVELPSLMRALSQLEKQSYLLRSILPYDERIRLLILATQGHAKLDELNRVVETHQHRITYIILEVELVPFSVTLNQIACNLRAIREEDNRHQKI